MFVGAITDYCHTLVHLIATTQQATLVWVPWVVGLASLLSSVLVFYHILHIKQKQKGYHQLTILVSAFDIITSLVWIVGTAAVNVHYHGTEQSWGIYGAKGNTASCAARWVRCWPRIGLSTLAWYYAPLTLAFLTRQYIHLSECFTYNIFFI